MNTTFPPHFLLLLGPLAVHMYKTITTTHDASCLFCHPTVSLQPAYCCRSVAAATTIIVLAKHYQMSQ